MFSFELGSADRKEKSRIETRDRYNAEVKHSELINISFYTG